MEYWFNIIGAPEYWWGLLTNYQLVTTYATIALVCIAFAAWVVTKRQLQAISNTRELESMLSIFKYIDTPHLSRARRFAGRHMKDIHIAPGVTTREEIDRAVRQLSHGKCDLEDMLDVLMSLNEISILIRRGLVSHPMEFYPTITRSWQCLGPLAEWDRSQRTPEYRDWTHWQFRQLAHEMNGLTYKAPLKKVKMEIAQSADEIRLASGTRNGAWAVLVGVVVAIAVVVVKRAR